MLDYAEQIALALSGDPSALGALYSETVATVYYSSLRITGAAYPAHVVTVRTYLLAFSNLSRLAYPAAFPVWLERLSVYLAYHVSAGRYTGQELDEAREQLIAFLRSFHRMNDAEIAQLLALEEDAVAGCQAQPEALNAEEFLMGKDAVLGIWHDICAQTITVPPEPAATAAASAPKPSSPTIAAEPSSPAPRRDVRQTAEYRKKRKRRRLFRIGAAVLAVALAAGAIFAAVHARQPEKRETEREVSRLANTLSLQLSGQVGEIYPLSDDMYFVSINLGYGGVEGLVVQYELAENAIRVSSPEGAALTESELEKITGDRYMQVLYNPTGSGSGAVIAGATDAAPGTDPQPAETPETPAPTKTPISAGSEGDSYEFVEGAGDFSIMLRINCRNVDFSRPMTVILDSAISKAIGEAGGLQILLNDARHSITLSTEQLSALCGAYGSVTLRFFARTERQYDISFYSEAGEKIPELDSTMTFTLPADGPMTYVFAVYDSGTESRGGVYDSEQETISFPVARSGAYELIGRETEIRDVGAMDAETAEAAYFLASLEFMPPDESGYFRPNSTLTRNEAIAVVGRMFLATDPALRSAYPDVDLGDPAYAYITFGTATNILTGLGDGTFGGETDISREDLLTVCGRTLLYRRGQEASEPDAPLGFDDEDALALYARAPVSALLESGVLSPGGALRPRSPATRGEAAVLLYRMYCILYGYHAAKD